MINAAAGPWISVHSKLPERDGAYLVFIKGRYNNYINVQFYYTRGTWNSQDPNHEDEYNHVVAWAQLYEFKPETFDFFERLVRWDQWK